MVYSLKTGKENLFASFPLSSFTIQRVRPEYSECLEKLIEVGSSNTMKTKIIATIGPACTSKSVLSQLITAGAHIFRLNFSHGEASQFHDIIANLRALEAEFDLPITIMQDLSGPKIRIGTLEEGSITFSKGDLAFLGPVKPENAGQVPFIPFDKVEILGSLESGDRLVLADGTLQFNVLEKQEN